MYLLFTYTPYIRFWFLIEKFELVSIEIEREREFVVRGRKMGNSFGCSASGERLVSAARDGDYVEAKMLLDCNPCLAKYSTFGGLNSPLHFAAAKGHNEVVPFSYVLFPFISVWSSLFFFVCFGVGLICRNCFVDCGIVAWEWSWCEFEELLWAGMWFEPCFFGSWSVPLIELMLGGNCFGGRSAPILI